MKRIALLLWVLGLLLAAATLFSTADRYVNDGSAITHTVGWGDGLERIGPAFFAASIVALISGCVFWVGHLLERHRG